MAEAETRSFACYEWDRIRRMPYQMDFSLPDGSPWLFAHMRLVNPSDAVVPMWWWSNIAVAERPDVRVIVPAEHAHHSWQLRADVPSRHAGA